MRHHMVAESSACKGQVAPSGGQVCSLGKVAQKEIRKKFRDLQTPPRPPPPPGLVFFTNKKFTLIFFVENCIYNG